MTDPYRTEDARAAQVKLQESLSKLVDCVQKEHEKTCNLIRSRVEPGDDVMRTIRWYGGLGALVLAILLLKTDCSTSPVSVEEIEACGRVCAAVGVKKVTFGDNYHRVELCECNPRTGG